MLLQIYYGFLPVIRMVECGIMAMVYLKNQPAEFAVPIFLITLAEGLLIGALESYINLRLRQRTKLPRLYTSYTHLKLQYDAD